METNTDTVTVEQAAENQFPIDNCVKDKHVSIVYRRRADFKLGAEWQASRLSTASASPTAHKDVVKRLIETYKRNNNYEQLGMEIEKIIGELVIIPSTPQQDSKPSASEGEYQGDLITKENAYWIANAFYGSDYPLTRKQFEDKLSELFPSSPSTAASDK